MKKITKVFLLLLVFCLPQFLQNKDTGMADALAPSQEIPVETGQVIQPSQVDDDDFLYDPEIISRKLFQKTLPPLSNRKKIIWSFRMADSDLFL